MDSIDNSIDILSTTCFILLLLLDTNRLLLEAVDSPIHVDSAVDFFRLPSFLDRSTLHLDAVTEAAIQQFRLWSTNFGMEEDLGFWVKPRSTTWFSQFLLHEYDDRRWVEMFRFSKRAVLQLAAMLGPAIRKKDTKYRLAVPVAVRIACILFKLAHGASFLICSEMFAVGRSTVSSMLRDVVHAINLGLRNEIQWPIEEEVSDIASNFRELCGLPGVVGAIDGTHFRISKPRVGPSDYYHFKSGGYTMACQAVVDSSRRFLDLYVGMPGSTHDSRMLRRSTLFHRGQHQTLWDHSFTFNGFGPYLLGDSGYPLLPWLMVPHRRDQNLSIADALFNRKLSRGRAVVENAFGLLKMTFRELHGKCDLDIRIVPDVVVCCAILHNVLLKDSDAEVERLYQIVLAQSEDENVPNNPVMTEDLYNDTEDIEVEAALVKRSDLGAYLTIQRTGRF